ncbi:MAG: type II toxin-antitoxin system PemK/MazF family toxin [Thermoanaerobaculia bacterium]|nr:type II toxin-antitoxin system PemK/MazF family toxin [Thermoanaerobaculia bacterium]
MRQYEIWWAELPAPVGRRPVLLLTRSSAYGYLNKVIVAEITTTIRGIPQEVPVGPAEGLPAPSVANLDNLHAVAKRTLTTKIGVVPASKERGVKRALGYALDWVELKVL